MPTLDEILQAMSTNSSLKTSNIPNDDSIQTNSHKKGGDPNCTICGGSGFYTLDVLPSHPQFGKVQTCVCRMLIKEQEKQQSLIHASQLGLLQACTFETFRSDLPMSPLQQSSLKKAYEVAYQYAQIPQGWLIFIGGYGCGKTHLATAIANIRLQKSQPVLFVNTPDLLDHLRSTYAPTSPVTYDQRFEEIKNIPLLILDDLGTQSNTEWAKEKLFQIFNHRYTSRLPTIVTTNEELDSIDIRVRSRIVDPSISRFVTITAPDYRQSGGVQEQGLSSLRLHVQKNFDTFSFRANELPRAESENLENAYNEAKRFAESLGESLRESLECSLVFYSPIHGNGKTHLAASIAHQAEKDGISAVFVFVPDLLDHLRATFNPASGISYDKLFNEVKNSQLLILDDLGTESATPWAREKLYQLLNYRLNAKLPTVITTSTKLDQLDSKLREYLRRSHEFFTIEAPSYSNPKRPKPSSYNRKKQGSSF